MNLHPDLGRELNRARQQDMLATAERHRLARQARDARRAVDGGGQPGWSRQVLRSLAQLFHRPRRPLVGDLDRSGAGPR